MLRKPVARLLREARRLGPRPRLGSVLLGSPGGKARLFKAGKGRGQRRGGAASEEEGDRKEEERQGSGHGGFNPAWRPLSIFKA